MKRFWSAIAMAIAIPTVPASAAELALAPSDSLVTLSARNRGHYDLIVPTIMVRASDGERLQDVTITINVLRAGKPVVSKIVGHADLVNDTAGLSGAGVPGFVNAQSLSPTGLAGLFGKRTHFAKSDILEPGQALGSFGNAFVTKGPADEVKVIVDARTAAGAPIRIEKAVKVSEHRSTIDYRSPVRGTWLMTVMPGLRSHHRFNPPSEFALDFFRTDAEGRIWRDDPLVAANFPGFAADVLAAADGVVISVLDGEIQDRAAMFRKPDEAPEAAGRRIQAYNMARYAKDFARAAAGNLVVIRHEKDGHTEYSSYGHLRAGVTVKIGQAVKQGDKIGEVGDTGDSAAAHLHFQINAGADPFTTKSLPVRLNGVRDPSGLEDVLETVTAQ